VHVGRYIEEAAESAGFLPLRERITWIKGDSPDGVATSSTAWGSWRSPANPVLRATAEPVWIFDKGTHRRTPSTENGPPDLTAAEYKAWTRNSWHISPAHADQSLDHPAIFPLELPRRLIKLYSFPGDIVLDPFMGSGTTLQAARLVGRTGRGVDISEKYCRLAAGRVSQQLLPLGFPC
jgi:site-specific DNA-methyltransferase (adenine-specific)